MDKIDFEREPDFQCGYLRGLADCKRALDDTDSRILKKCADVLESHPVEIGRAKEKLSEQFHASAAPDHKCADCYLDQEPCPTCYAAWWATKHPNTHLIEPAADKQDGT